MNSSPLSFTRLRDLLVIAVLFVLGCPTAFAQASFPLTEITVFESGARLRRTDRVTLDSGGQWEGTLYGLSRSVQPATIQVHLPEGWSMTGTAFRLAADASVASQTASQVAAMREEVSDLAQTQAMRTALHSTYEEELQMLLANRDITGTETLLVEDLREAANFWRARVRELKYSMLELSLEMDDLQAAQGALQTQIDSLNRLAQTERGVIGLRLQGPAEVSGEVHVDYVTQEASWRPVFEAEVAEDGGVNMTRFAACTQHTGNDWKGVPIQFAAGNPMQGLAPPEVRPLRLRPGTPAPQRMVGYEFAPRQMTSAAAEPAAFLDAVQVVPTESGSMERYVFAPQGPVKIAGNGQPERVALGAFELAAELRMLLLPGHSDEAYQLASSAAWAGAQLMPGEVQVIAGGAYRGAFAMALPAPGDTLEFPVGQDPQIRCSRTRRADKCRSSVFGHKKSSRVVWEISVVNQHNREVDVRVLDQIPVSNHEDITVEVESLSGGELDPDTGEVNWHLTLAPGEQRKVLLDYEVTYPKSFYLPQL